LHTSPAAQGVPPVPQLHAPFTHRSDVRDEHVVHAVPVLPHTGNAGVTQFAPFAHPVVQSVGSDWHTPPLQRSAVPPHGGFTPQTHASAPVPQRSVFTASQATQARPPFLSMHVVGKTSAWHALALQHPAGHDVVSHMHAPALQRCPVAQGLLQTPQCSLLIWKLTLQPASLGAAPASVSQRPKLVAHANTHAPASQVDGVVVFWLPHTFPHAPQLCGVARFASHPSVRRRLQSAWPGRQAPMSHAPLLQTAVAPGIAHGAQLGPAQPNCGSFVGTQRALHGFCPGGQSSVGTSAPESPGGVPVSVEPSDAVASVAIVVATVKSPKMAVHPPTSAAATASVTRRNSDVRVGARFT
jgi:hypothetical protein